MQPALVHRRHALAAAYGVNRQQLIIAIYHYGLGVARPASHSRSERTAAAKTK
jgi:hypothetical protein